MVWNSTQSALYKAVDDYNSSVNTGENIADNYAGKTPRKCAGINPENCAKKPCENYTENCTDFGRKNCENDCKNCPKNDAFSRLISDRDFLLVAGIILILLNEKADFKLILALAIVLLG